MSVFVLLYVQSTNTDAAAVLRIYLVRLRFRLLRCEWRRMHSLLAKLVQILTPDAHRVHLRRAVLAVGWNGWFWGHFVQDVLSKLAQSIEVLDHAAGMLS